LGPEPRAERFAVHEGGNEFPFVRVRAVAAESVHECEGGDGEGGPQGHEHEADAACRRQGGGILWTVRDSGQHYGAVYVRRAADRIEAALPPQGEDAEAEGEAGDGDRRGPREGSVQDQAAQPVLDRTRQGLITPASLPNPARTRGT